MPKTSTDLVRHALNGPTMGTRWSAIVFTEATCAVAALRDALQSAVDEVDGLMSTWNPESALMRFNAAPADIWLPLPDPLLEVLDYGLDVGRQSGGAFDIGLGDAVSAWGFGAQDADTARIKSLIQTHRQPAHAVLEIDRARGLARKSGPLQIDLSGIAKGYGVDRLARVAQQAGLNHGLFAIDGELVALGQRPDGGDWAVAVEKPDYGVRSPHSILELRNTAVATSGDYRHWVDVNGRRLSHTMDPRRGAPLLEGPASVTVLAPNCMAADAWATAFMVLGEVRSKPLAKTLGFEVLFLERDASQVA
ncbi:FAD:protein FMN transferase [Rhizobium sp. C4]|uniref:FAD:protein FMN transferase n=1 Tax=Rhizobium sp. C4 TaxID=1349800 RepID=UPI001E43B2C4|nr:FAD:protein FMN transferase [Rhizobium sp. C4]MCD2172273.1 FAD:protein FMN transferase [Rhizobium sp. C4]